MLVMQEMNMRNQRLSQDNPEISEVNSSPYKVGNYIYPINESIPFQDYPDHEQDNLQKEMLTLSEQVMKIQKKEVTRKDKHKKPIYNKHARFNTIKQAGTFTFQSKVSNEDLVEPHDGTNQSD